MMYSSQFQIAQLRSKNISKGIEAVGVFILSLFTSAFLPSLLIQYVYAEQALLEAPKLLTYIPVFSFVVGVGYFLLVLANNFKREKKAMALENQLISCMGDCSDCNGDCQDCCCSPDDMLIDMSEVLDKASKKKAAKPKKKKATTKRKKSSKK